MAPLIALAWFAFIVVMGAVYQRLTQWVTRFSIFTVFFVALFVRFGISVPFDNNITKETAGLSMPPSALTDYYIALVLVYLTIAATLALFKLLPSRPKRVASETPVNGNLLAVLILAVSIVVAIIWVVLPWNDFRTGLVFFTSLHHSAADFATHRGQYGHGTAAALSSVAYIGGFLRFGVLPPLTWIGLFHMKQGRQLIPIVAFALGLLVIIGLATGEKQPELYIGVGLVLALLIRSEYPTLFSWRVAALVAIGIFGIIPVLYHFQYPQVGYSILLESTMVRLTSIYSFNAQLRFLFYPNIHPFLYGASSLYVETAMRLLHLASPGSTPPETYIPSVILGNGNAGGSWNTAFFAEAWADFGFVGCFIESAVVALILAAVDGWYLNSGRGPITQGTYVALLISTIYFTDTALSTALWTYGFLPAIILCWLLKRYPSVDPAQLLGRLWQAPAQTFDAYGPPPRR
jgi:hypothetical protein